MQYRKITGTDLQCSAIGFGLWTVSTGWWGSYSDDAAVSLLREAQNQGVTLFDAADTYGNGRSETLLAKAFPATARDGVVIATKVGYDFVSHGAERKGQREIPQDFRPESIRLATEAALQRLRTSHIDILQLHNIKMEQVEDDSLWECLETLRSEGKIRVYGAALGPAIGWLAEGIMAIRRRKLAILQHIYNYLEQYPGSAIHQAASDLSAPTQFFIRVPHSSGMLEGKYTEDTVFPPGDHRNHRPRSWLLRGVRKVEQLRFLEQNGRSLAQAAIQWLLSDPAVLSVLPNIYDSAQLSEFASAPDSPPLSPSELAQMQHLHSHHFGMEPDVCHFKGTMQLPEIFPPS